MKKIIYLRSSTSDQKISIEVQKEACVTHCQSKGWDYEILKEHESAKSTKRNKFQQLMEMVENNDVSHLIIFKLCRLSRNLRDILNIVEHLNKKGCKMISLKESFDTSTAQGEFFFHMMGSVAHFERGIISERTKQALAQRKKEGIRLGRPPEKRIKLANKVRAMRKGRHQWKDICKKLNINHRTAKACLSNN